MVKRSKRRWYHLSFGDVIALFAVILGLAILSFYAIDQNRTYNFLDIKKPVELDKSGYHQGDVIYGFFYGSIYTTNQPVILRRLECKTQRFSLRPVVTSSATPSKLTGKKTPIIVLTPDVLSVRNAPILPDTGCVITMCNQYTVQPTFGNPRTLGECYYTKPFDILPDSAPSTSSRDSAVDTEPNVPAIPAEPTQTKPVTQEQVDSGITSQQPATTPSTASQESSSQPESKGLVENLLDAIGGIL